MLKWQSSEFVQGVVLPSNYCADRTNESELIGTTLCFIVVGGSLRSLTLVRVHGPKVARNIAMILRHGRQAQYVLVLVELVPNGAEQEVPRLQGEGKGN